MDTQQIDTAVMFPTSGLGIGRVRDPQLNAALCKGITISSDYCKASPRLKAVANYPSIIHFDAQGTQPCRHKVGSMRRNAVAQAHSKNLGPEFYALYEEAQNLNTPISIHAFGGDNRAARSSSVHLLAYNRTSFPVLRKHTYWFLAVFREISQAKSVTSKSATAGCLIGRNGWTKNGRSAAKPKRRCEKTQ
jgi:hypothetical protein